MGRLPDISGLFWWVIFGFACAAVLGAGTAVYVAYHVGKALLLYWGAE